jgi:murein L,D-transpeptidase YcbB/YkuD
MVFAFDAPRPAGALRKIWLGLALAAGLSAAACNKTPPSGAIASNEVEHALEVLEAAPQHGFAPDKFQVERIRELGRSDKRQDLAERDKLLRAQLVAYARAQHGLSVPKSQWPQAWGSRPAEYDADAELTAALKERKFRQWLDGQAPTTPEYQALQKAYLAYIKIDQDGGWPQVAPRTPLRLGAAGPDVQVLRERLAFEDAAMGEVEAATPFDANLAAALTRFQAAHGLPTTGVVDKPTLAELNVPARTRAAQIRASLERMRWMPREDHPTRVDVNIAAATMTFFDGGKPSVHMLAASGKPGDETPMLASSIDNIVLNPPWNVPEGIAQEELYPKEAANPGYFAANNYVTENGRLIQKPGPDSALGLVKFDFDNPYAVYLHDTPAKAAFNQTRRAVSHGCVRLAQAVPFAKMLLASEPNWSPEKVDQVLATGETTTVKLSRKIPVRLMYLTAFPDGGRIAFRPDVYGWDSQLLALLDGGPKTVAQRS